MIEALSFDFDVKFPLSLVISRKAITRYQLVFRFLLMLKYLESLLTSMWMEHSQPMWRRKLEAPDMERWKRRIYNLRAQMLQWVQQMLTFTTQDVLEANWKKLEAKLAKVQTVDQLIQDHVDYLDVCLKECMLTTDRMLPVSFARKLCALDRFLTLTFGVAADEDHRDRVAVRAISAIIKPDHAEIFARFSCGVRD